MALFAITPNGVGKPVGYRSIQPGWSLNAEETFEVEVATPEGLVLAEDALSLRVPTSIELNEQALEAATLESLPGLRAAAFDAAMDFMAANPAGAPIEVTDYIAARDSL